MRSLLLSIALMLPLLVAPQDLSAQVRPGGPPGRAPQRQELEGRLQREFGRMIAGRLGLDREGVDALQGVMQSFREDRMALNRDQAELRQRLRAPALDDLSDGAAQEILQEMVRLQQVELDLYRQEQAELLTVLSPVQLVRFYQIREEWGQRIQQLRRGGGRGMSGGMGLADGLGGTGSWPRGMGASVEWDPWFSPFR